MLLEAIGSIVDKCMEVIETLRDERVFIYMCAACGSYCRAHNYL